MVADLIRALVAAVAGAVLPGYFWAAVLRPTSGLGERLAYSTVVSMASVPTVAVILARVARTGIELWVALAAVLFVFGTGLLAFRLKGPAPGTAAPVLRMPEPTRDPWVLGLVAGALLVGLVLMAAHRPPAALLALVAVALLAGGALMAWPRPAAPENPPPVVAAGCRGLSVRAAAGPAEPAISAAGSLPNRSAGPPASAAGPSGTGSAGRQAPAPGQASPAGPPPAARPFGLPLSVVRDGGLAVILVLTACRDYSGVVRFEWPYIGGQDQFSHAVMAEQMLAHGQYPSYLIYPPGFSALTAVICRFAGLTPLALFPVLAPMLLVVTALGAYALATRLWGWQYGLGAAALPPGLVLTGAFNGFAGSLYPDLISAYFLLVMTVAALVTLYEAPTARSVILVAVVGASPVLYHSVATLYAAVLLALVAVIGLPYLIRGGHRRETRALLFGLAGAAVLAACYAVYVYNPGGILGGKSSAGGAVSAALGSQAPPAQSALLSELGPPVVWFGLLGLAALAVSLRYLRRPAQVLTVATVVGWCVLMYLGSRTSLDGFPQRFERDLGAPLSVIAVFGVGVVVRSLPLRGAATRTAPALAATIAGIVAAVMLLAQTVHAVGASDRSAGKLLSHRVAAAGQWLARHNTGGTIITTPYMNRGISNRAMLALGGYTGLQAFSPFRTAHPRSLPTAGKGPLLDSQTVLLAPTELPLRGHPGAPGRALCGAVQDRQRRRPRRVRRGPGPLPAGIREPRSDHLRDAPHRLRLTACAVGVSPGDPAGLVATMTVAPNSADRATRGTRPPRLAVWHAVCSWRSLTSTSRLPPSASHRGASAATRRSTSSPSAPPSSAPRGSCSRASAGNSPTSAVGTYGTLAARTPTRPRSAAGSGSNRSPA